MVRKWKAKPKLNEWETLVKARLVSAGLHPESQVQPFGESRQRFDFRLKLQKVFVEVDGGYHKKRVGAAWTDADKTFKATALGYKTVRIAVPETNTEAARFDFGMRAAKMATEIQRGIEGYYY